MFNVVHYVFQECATMTTYPLPLLQPFGFFIFAGTFRCQPVRTATQRLRMAEFPFLLMREMLELMHNDRQMYMYSGRVSCYREPRVSLTARYVGVYFHAQTNNSVVLCHVSLAHSKIDLKFSARQEKRLCKLVADCFTHPILLSCSKADKLERRWLLYPHSKCDFVKRLWAARNYVLQVNPGLDEARQFFHISVDKLADIAWPARAPALR